MRLGRRLGAPVLLLAGALSGCGSTGSSAPGRVTGSLTVLAAASLTESFRDGEAVLERRHPGLTARFSFAGSQQVVSSLLAGAPADVVATADPASMKQLTEASLVDPPRVLAHNRLEIAVAAGNPRGIRGLPDLARGDLSVVLEDPSVPAGRFARQALRAAGVSVTPRSNELDVKAALQKVVAGDADAAIVYVTDVSSAGGRVDGVVIPDGQNVTATYLVAAVRGGPGHAAALLFVDEAVSGSIQEALRARGFEPS